MFVTHRTAKSAKSSDQNDSTGARQHIRWASSLLVLSLVFAATGCSSLQMPGTGGLDLMSPSSKLLSLGAAGKHKSPYRMADGSSPGDVLAADGSMTMEAYNRIRQAKAQNAVVLQVAGDEQPVRVLPLPDGGKAIFVSELLEQTGVLEKFGHVQATLYRQSPDSISGIKMLVKFSKNGKVDPATDYGLRAGDRVQVRQQKFGALQMLVDTAMRR